MGEKGRKFFLANAPPSVPQQWASVLLWFIDKMGVPKLLQKEASWVDVAVLNDLLLTKKLNEGNIYVVGIGGRKCGEHWT